MKKLTIIFCLLMTLNSCTNDSKENQLDLLAGSWEKTEIMENNSLSQSLQYKFNTDKTFIVSTVIINNATTEIIGYRYRALGSYSINGNVLVLNLSEIYTHDDTTGLFSNINDLELLNNDGIQIITFSINRNQNVLTFTYPPCGTAEICIDTQSFQRIY